MKPDQIYGLSIIVPTFNEQDNIEHLLRRIDATIQPSTLPYEVIFVDDHSTDATCENIHKLSSSYPAQLYLKQGKKGKAYSILEGVTHAKYDTVAMIDADLQYPPEALVPMIQIMQSGADVVIASREKRNEKTLRQITSRAFAYFFCTLLHNLPYDVQSGLKIFRREIFERIQITPTPWTFDMEFLLKARNAGYRFASYDITFAERAAGTSKVSVFHSAIEIGTNALKLKFVDPEPVPFSKNVRDVEGHGFHFQSQKYMTYGQLHTSDSALRNFTTGQKILIADVVALLLALLVFNWHATVVVSIAMLTIIYLADLYLPYM